jgi:uncharacterized protein (UPF0332 family)
MKDELRSLVDYRLQEARDSREEAEILLGRGKSRGALNRAYYSLFYAALALLASKQLTAVKHSGVISLVHREFVKTGIITPEVAKSLDIAFDLRNKSDYRDFVIPEEARVRELIQDAGAFLAAVECALAKL